jgi:signal transduction histidine kinase
MAMVAHEFRNPLAAINNAAAALQHPNATAATTARIGPLLTRQVTQLSRLASDLMSATSGNSDRFRLEWHCFDLALLIESAVEGFQPALANKRQTLANAVGDGPWLVKGDPVRIAQVLRNLLDNACKYTPEGGHIGIGLASRGTMIEVTIADDGIGLATHALDTVFGLFAQEDKTHGRQVGGLGIGLAVAKQLIEAHGGRIQAASAGLGRGSQFTFSLQRAD